MSSRTAFPLLLSLVLLGGCGGPSAGGACHQARYDCQDEATALECREGAWQALPCRGPAGCNVADGRVDCDTSLNREGDACASSAEGRGRCAEDGTALLECRQHVLRVTRSCSRCALESEQLVCTP